MIEWSRSHPSIIVKFQLTNVTTDAFVKLLTFTLRDSCRTSRITILRS